MADLDLDAIERTMLCNADVPCGKLTMGHVWQDVNALALAAEVRRLRAENVAMRALVARFYTQAWEDPLTDDEMALLDPIVNDAVREQDRG
jgi:hypothetical protein